MSRTHLVWSARAAVIGCAFFATLGPAAAQSVVFDILGQVQSQAVGIKCDAAGDVDSDGVEDLLMRTSGTDDKVRAYSGATGEVVLEISFSADSVSAVGDVNFDGHADVAYSAPHAFGSGGIGTAGVVRIASGSTGDVLLEMWGDSTEDNFGSAIDECGDVDGDGWPDILIGATGDDGGVGSTGMMFVCSGRDGSRSLSIPLFGGVGLGWAVAGIGDHDLDGFPDVMGADGSPYYVHCYSGQTAAELGVLTPIIGPVLTGLKSISGIDDKDGDGVGEIVLGVSGTQLDGEYVGSVDFFDGTTYQPVHQILGTVPGGGFGWVMSAGRDLDADGVPDLVVTACDVCDFSGCDGPTGSATVISGADWSIVSTVNGVLSYDEFGYSVANLGDINGDGYGEFAVGASEASYVAPKAGMIRVFSALDLPLTADLVTLKIGQGGTQTQRLQPGPQHAGDLYVMLGSVTGISPGLDFLPWHLPLNPDAYTSFALTPGASPLVPLTGVLGTDGKATCHFVVPPGLPTDPFAGLSFQHAYVLLDSGTLALDFASNSVPLTIKL